VSERPGHRTVLTPAGLRLRLADAAFAGLERTAVELDPYGRTVDLLRARPDLADPVVIVGADQLAAFTTWKEPGEVLRLATLAVAARPGVDDEVVDAALGALAGAARVRRFAVEQVPVSSSQLRERVSRGQSIDRLVPPAVASLVRELGLYRSAQG
jgi:nicotinate-nucleotide adenylyltransferase